MKFKQIGLGTTLTVIIVVAVLAVLGVILALVIPHRKKPAEENAAEEKPEEPADPNYSSILADDEENGDPYDRSSGIQPEDNDSET